MIEQYDKEMSQVHAPAELIQRTKAAMHQEEERIQTIDQEKDRTTKKKSRKRQVWTLVVVAAAAILVLAVLPVVLLGSRSAADTKMPVRAGRAEPATSLLPQENSPIPRLSSAESLEEGVLTEVSEMPAEFEDVEPVEWGQAKVWALAGKEGWKAYIESAKGTYLYEDQAASREEFLQKIEELLAEEN